MRCDEVCFAEALGRLGQGNGQSQHKTFGSSKVVGNRTKKGKRKGISVPMQKTICKFLTICLPPEELFEIVVCFFNAILGDSDAHCTCSV